MPGGRPSKLTPELIEAAEAYLDGGWEKAGHTLPSHIGLFKELKLAKSTAYGWADSQDNDMSKQFSDILAFISTLTEFYAIDGGVSSKLNSNIVKLLLGKFGYSERTETDNIHSFDFSNLSDEELKRIAGST